MEKNARKNKNEKRETESVKELVRESKLTERPTSDVAGFVPAKRK